MNDYSPLTQREFLRTYYVAQGINIVGSCNDLFVLSLTTKQKALQTRDGYAGANPSFRLPIALGI